MVCHGVSYYTLDGDNILRSFYKNLGFSPKDKEGNIPGIAKVAKLYTVSGLVCLTSFILLYTLHCNSARQIHEGASLPFVGVFVDGALHDCETEKCQRTTNKHKL